MEIKNTIKFILIVTISLCGFRSQAQDIKISDIDLQVNNNKLFINWSTNEDDTANYFEIEKSKDGKTYKTMAYVLGPDPSKPGSQFGYFDKVTQLRGATTYYRIKHIDKDGNIIYSAVKTATL